VTMHLRSLVAAAAGLWMALPVLGQEPARLVLDQPANQQLADTIAQRLRQSGQLHQYRIDIAVQDGVVEVSGLVASPEQRAEVLQLVHQVPGVGSVRDQLTLPGAIVPVQARAPLPQAPAPTPLPQPTVVTPNAAVGPDGVVAEPAPISQAPTPGPYDLNPPVMPPYAWPTYAPYNNYSRVAYPEAYPYPAWPFIGPPYPFPKVPLGWRAVKLEWQDGHWWFSKVATKHDWWRVRYW
jgi:BON domain